MPYNPAIIANYGLGFSHFARRYSGNSRIPVPVPKKFGRETEMSCWFLFLSVLRCFTSRGLLLQHALEITDYSAEFPHSDIFGSKLARQLPETFRRHAASFIALRSLGIHHTPFRLPRGSLKTT